MPIQTDPLKRPRHAASEETPCGSESLRPLQTSETPEIQEIGPTPEPSDPTDRPRPEPLPLVTQPADHRYMKGRY